MAQKISKEEAFQFLEKHTRFLLVGHIRPDGDDIGSICALHNALESMGKEADMVINDELPDRFNFIETTRLINRDIPEGRTYDAVVFTDLANRERAGEIHIPENVESICIDHHVSNEGYTDYLYLRENYAATAELLAEMFFDYGLKLCRDTCNA